MSIGDCWLDDEQLNKLSRQIPSTDVGRRLMQTTWPTRYQGLVSSDTYRGCAIALTMLHTRLRYRELSIGLLESAIEAVDQALQTSPAIRAREHVVGGASLAIANAWQTVHCGLPAAGVVGAYESEAIYAAQKFATARQYEAAGHQLP
jgi:hypothetical protein